MTSLSRQTVFAIFYRTQSFTRQHPRSAPVLGRSNSLYPGASESFKRPAAALGEGRGCNHRFHSQSPHPLQATAAEDCRTPQAGARFHPAKQIHPLGSTGVIGQAAGTSVFLRRAERLMRQQLLRRFRAYKPREASWSAAVLCRCRQPTMAIPDLIGVIIIAGLAATL